MFYGILAHSTEQYVQSGNFACAKDLTFRMSVERYKKNSLHHLEEKKYFN